MTKCITCWIILMLLPMLSIADDFASEKQLDTLFTSPGERQQLNALRASGDYGKVQAPAPTDKPVFREPLKVEMRGVLIKNGEKPVVWVNRGNTLESEKIEDGIRVRPEQTDKASKQVPVRIYNRTYPMKPGEVWTESDNRVRDRYQIK